MTNVISFPAWVLVLALAGDKPFALRPGDTVAFFGDSITQGGAYIESIDAYLLTRFPKDSFRLINVGISSETVSGTSEPDHHPRRPDAHVRFDRDIPPIRPTVVVACFGMNDGNYHPFEEPRYAKYQAGIHRLIERIRAIPTVRLITLVTPPPYDPYRRGVGDPQAKSFGYKFAAIDYDQTLERYSAFLRTLGKPDLLVADAHLLSNEHLRRRRSTQVSFHLAPDAVHPNATGHWLLSQAILTAWNAPGRLSALNLDARTKTPSPGVADQALDSETGVFSFFWDAPIPLPFDPACDPESLRLENVQQRFNANTLTVTGLERKSYRLRVERTGEPPIELGTFSREQWAEGVDLPSPVLPTQEQGKRLLGLVQSRRRQIYTRWRSALGKTQGANVTADAINQAEKEVAPTLDEIRQLSNPLRLKINLAPTTN